MKSFRDIIPAVVYGGSDGVVTTFSVMAGAAGAGLDPRIVIILGSANLASDGFSMASADYLSEESKEKATEKKSLRQAFATFFAFFLIGIIPLLPFFAALYIDLPVNKFVMSIVCTILAFISIGYFRAHMLNKNKVTMIFQSVSIGTLCAGLSYFVGLWISSVLG